VVIFNQLNKNYLIAVSQRETMKAIGILLIFGAVFTSAEKARFDFYRLYEVIAESQLQIEIFRQIYEYPDGVS
jgi:hypothetical protein